MVEPSARRGGPPNWLTISHVGSLVACFSLFLVPAAAILWRRAHERMEERLLCDLRRKGQESNPRSSATSPRRLLSYMYMFIYMLPFMRTSSLFEIGGSQFSS
jgi:hypothetical protein